jgi:glycosyltransferase involved in cell wall biosynthesis
VRIHGAQVVTATRPRKVLYVSPVAERGGAETVLLNILKFHDRRQFEPIVCFLKTGPLMAEVHELGVRSVAVETSRLRSAGATGRAIRDIRRIIRTMDVDVVFGNMAMGHIYGGLAAVGTPAQCVWFQHGIPSRRDPVDWLAAAVPAARIFVNSRATAAEQARLPRCAGRMQLLYYGLDVARFSPSRHGCRPLLGALGVPSSSPVVAMVARFQRWKGHDIFVRAAALVVAERPDVRFVLIGDTMFGLEPNFKGDLHRLVHELGLDRHVVFAGFRDDVPALLDEVDVVAHPAVKPEPFGLAVVEALLMTKPVIASDQAGPAEIITHAQTGVLVPPGDSKALARAIVSLVREPEKGAALGRRGRDEMLNRFSMSRMIAELEAGYHQVLTVR